MPGPKRCDEILRLIDAVLDEPAAPVATPVATVAPPAPPIVHPAAEQAQGWLGRLHLRHRDARYVAPPPPAPADPVRFHPSLHTAAELASAVRSPRSLPGAG